MSQEESQPRSQADEELEREIRRDRTFSLADAIGRLAGPGMMKGASPVARTRQAEAVIQEYLRLKMCSNAGCLSVVLLRQVMASEKLLSNPDQPLVVLADYIQRVLASEYLVKELVRETDFEWGRIHDERPYFEVKGSPADPDDPFTFESVRLILSELLRTLGTDIAGDPTP